MTRLRLIIAGLECWLDHWPAPKGSLSDRTSGMSRGDVMDTGKFNPARDLVGYKVCDSCGGAKRFNNGHTCVHCRGSGWMKDSGAGKLRVAEEKEFAKVPDELLRHARTRESVPFYEDLTAAMIELNVAMPTIHSLLVWTHVLQVQAPKDLPPAAKPARELGLVFVSKEMPERLQVPKDVRDYAENRLKTERERMKILGKGKGANRAHQAARDREIVRLVVNELATQEEVAEMFDVSQPRVSQIVAAARVAA